MSVCVCEHRCSCSTASNRATSWRSPIPRNGPARTDSSSTDRTQDSGAAVMQDKAMISLAGVTKVFYTDDLETHALDGIHLDVARGEFLSISGPSGCGKSTLLAILGLLRSEEH